MPAANLSHRRTHNLLLFSKLLNLRERSSPFTLILDDLEQPAAPLLGEYIRRCKISKTRTIFVSFETQPTPPGVDCAILLALRKSPAEVSQCIAHAIKSDADDPSNCRASHLIIIDTLNPLCAWPDLYLPAYLSSLLDSSPTVQTSMVAVYHQDTPLSGVQPPSGAYSPHPMVMLNYLATTVLILHSFHHLLAQKGAKDRSVNSPVFGLEETKEGILVGVTAGPSQIERSRINWNSVVIEMEYRRKSGRSIGEWYFLLPTLTSISQPQGNAALPTSENFILLDDHFLFKSGALEPEVPDGTVPQSTFSLTLTERQKIEREGVVLPYFDAQKADGEGGGGRILYDMGAEDDFDDEEDEI